MKRFSPKSKEKIVFFCPSIEEGGVEKNLINISNILSKNFKINLITANQNKKKYFNQKINFISPESNYFNNKCRIIKTLFCIFLLLTKAVSDTM